MPRLTYKKSTSLGEAISSVCFFSVGIVWLSYGLDHVEMGDWLRATGLFLCSIISIMACFRYVISNLLFKIYIGFEDDGERK